MKKFFRNPTGIILILIIIMGAFLRLYNINWDQGTHLHPDERAIVMFTLPLSFPQDIQQFLNPDSPLNPHFFAYGNLPLYILKIASLFAGIFNKEFLTYEKINILGRFLSVLFDLLTIFLIFKIGKILFNQRVGLASAFLYAVSVLAIQASHFFTVDILLTFLVTLTIYRLIKFYKLPNKKNAVLVGVSFGLSLATKISALPLMVGVILAIFTDFMLIFLKTPHKPNLWFPHTPSFLKRLLIEGLVIAFFTSLTFVFVQPYALIDLKEFLYQNSQQALMTHSAYVFPYTLQYVGKIPFIYELKNIFLWGQGPIISFLCFAGIIYFIMKIKAFSKEKEAEGVIILIFLIVYFSVVSSFAVGWIRYMLPIYPLLSLFGGAFLVLFILKNIEKVKTKLIRFLIYSVVFTALIIWPLSFMSIYEVPNTRVAATNWINKTIPSGKILAVEHWDDQLPLFTNNNYVYNILTLYDQPDDAAKWKTINQKITHSDYIIISSNRLYVPLEKLSDCKKYLKCYPQTAKYYEKLFAGKLEFKKIAEFTSFPTVPFLNIKINDQSADESFTVYDHPKVMIFKENN